MTARDLVDSTRETWILDADNAPTREIVYTRDSDDVATTLNSFVGGGNFKIDEKDLLKDFETFRGLKLYQKPNVKDTIAYNGEIWKVEKFTRLGSLYTVYGSKKRHNGRPSR